MIVFDNQSDINAVQGILQKVAEEVNSYYWHRDSEVDLERASELRNLREHLIKRGYIDSGYDLARLTYGLVNLYPLTEVSEENNRQYQSVLLKLTDGQRGQHLYEVRELEKDTEDKVKMSTKFDMALQKLLDSSIDDSEY